jgi:acyl dehydratase
VNGVTNWEQISVPLELPEVVDEISYQRVVMNTGATWDFFPGHYDPMYAERQGQPTIFVNTMHVAGFADRIGTDWAGPHSRVVRRKMTLAGSIYAGDTMVGRGRVVAKRCDTSVDPWRFLLDLQVEIANQRGELCCPVELTLQVSPVIDGGSLGRRISAPPDHAE